jgi:cell fate (sporulation/competence/biofilm development) regulator YlbF (YheA/YmcA/DUF963 family)
MLGLNRFFMEKEIEESLQSLAKALHYDPRVMHLNALEAQVMADPTVQLLSKKKDAAEEAYSLVLTYAKEDSPEAQEKQKQLYEAKKTLDANPLVAEYNAAYIVVRDLYMAIDDILFSPFRKKSLLEDSH